MLSHWSFRLRWRLAVAGIACLGWLFVSSPARVANAQQQPAGAENATGEADHLALVEAGRSLAAERCERCHSIDETSVSTNTDAPPFREFADKWPAEDLEEALGEGIVTGHEEMPEFVFTSEEIAAFVEFLGSLAPKQQ